MRAAGGGAELSSLTESASGGIWSGLLGDSSSASNANSSLMAELSWSSESFRGAL